MPCLPNSAAIWKDSAALKKVVTIASQKAEIESFLLNILARCSTQYLHLNDIGLMRLRSNTCEIHIASLDNRSQVFLSICEDEVEGMVR